VSWAWWDWPSTSRLGRPSVLCRCWLGHVTRKIVFEMTYNVSSGTLNPTIPYSRILLVSAVVIVIAGWHAGCFTYCIIITKWWWSSQTTLTAVTHYRHHQLRRHHHIEWRNSQKIFAAENHIFDCCFDFVGFSSRPSERLSVIGLCVVIYIFKNIFVSFCTSPFSELSLVRLTLDQVD